jgi:hypothetical protein
LVPANAIEALIIIYRPSLGEQSPDSLATLREPDLERTFAGVRFRSYVLQHLGRLAIEIAKRFRSSAIGRHPKERTDREARWSATTPATRRKQLVARAIQDVG